MAATATVIATAAATAAAASTLAANKNKNINRKRLIFVENMNVRQTHKKWLILSFGTKKKFCLCKFSLALVSVTNGYACVCTRAPKCSHNQVFVYVAFT